MNRPTDHFKQQNTRFVATPIIQQTIDERLESDFSGSFRASLKGGSFSSFPQSPPPPYKAKLPQAITSDDKLRKMGSPRKRDELDDSNHQRIQIFPQSSLSDLDASSHVCRWMLEE